MVALIERTHTLICIKYNNHNLIFNKEHYINFCRTITEAIRAYNTRNPLSSSGINRELIRSILKEKKIYKDHKSNELTLNLFLTRMEKEGIVSQRNNRWSITGYKPVITQIQQGHIDAIETLVSEGGFGGVYEDELFEKYSHVLSDNELFIAILNLLIETKVVYKRDKIVLHAGNVSDAKTMLYTFLTAHTEGIKVGEFRELLGTNRKMAMVYLDILEEEGVLYREGDYRFLSKS